MGTLKTPQYENCQVMSPEGRLMFRTHNRKGIWYLDRNLAKKLSDDPLIIQLTFTPKGVGHINDPYYLQEMKNRCVVCGLEKDLTKHHIVPICYRKYFPRKLKEHTAYDVMALCEQCHFKYEIEAFKLKQELAVKYNIPVSGEGFRKDSSLAKAQGYAKAILNHGDKIPQDCKELLSNRIKEYLGRDVKEEDLKNLTKTDPYDKTKYVYHGERVVEQVGDVERFVFWWREHFLSTMNPKYMPNYWEVHRSIYKEEFKKMSCT